MHFACPNRNSTASSGTENDENQCHQTRLRIIQVMSRSHSRHPGVIVDAPECSLWIFSTPSENHVLRSLCVVAPGRPLLAECCMCFARFGFRRCFSFCRPPLDFIISAAPQAVLRFPPAVTRLTVYRRVQIPNHV